jgi:uncharacterized protein (DUF1778 family)
MPQQRNCPINIRALESQRELIDKAASYKKTSRSDFILESACREAKNVLLDQRLFLVDDDTYQAFVDLLESPVRENLELKALLKSKSPWEKQVSLN